MTSVTGGSAVCIGMGIILTVTAVPALAETSITSCPFRITEPGNYKVDADLTCDELGGITIRASNVSLKLNGHKITAAGVGATAITVGDTVGGFDHILIQGPGLITGNPNTLAYGIFMQNAAYSQVSQVNIVGASTGISTFLCRFLTMTSNVIGRGNGGVTTNRTDSTSITGNDTSGNSTGISLFLGSGNIVNNNIANGNSTAGIAILGGGRFYGNVTNGNGQYGIFNQFTLTQAFNNISKANGLFDLFEAGGCSGSWSDNVFFTANVSCIR
jgi:hypothetical protein